jgi:hypothetical protein
MKSFMDEKITSRWFWEKSQQRHSNRIKEIKSKISTRINNSPPRISRLSTSRSKFLEKERKSKIQSNNDKLLNVLVDISRGRRSTSTGLILDSALTLPKKKSLNFIARQQQVLKINNDNEALARRLLKTTHGLSFKKFDQEWKNTVKYKKTISKARFRSIAPSEKSRKSTREKTGIQLRTKSLGEDPIMFLSRDKQGSPFIDTQRSEVVFIEEHKPSEDLLVKGQTKTRFLKSCEPVQINPPKTYIKLEPLNQPARQKANK